LTDTDKQTKKVVVPILIKFRPVNRRQCALYKFIYLFNNVRKFIFMLNKWEYRKYWKCV